MERRLASVFSICALAIGCGASPAPETTVALVAPPAAATAAPSSDPETEPPSAHPRSKPNPHRAAAEDKVEDVTRELARKLFREGAEAYEQADYLRALQKFQEAYDLVQNQALLFNIASAELRLGNVPSACRLFRKYIADGDPADPRILEVQRQVAQRCRGTP